MCRVILKHLLHSSSPEWCYAVVFSPYLACEILFVFLISNQSNKNIQRLSHSQGHCFIVFLTRTLSLVLISQVHSALCVFVFVCMLGFTCMYHVECVLPSFLYTSSLLLSPLFPHVSSLSFPHAEMGHLSLTGTKTRTGTLDLAWPVHVGESSCSHELLKRGVVKV